VTFDNALPLLILLTSLVGGSIIFLIPEHRRGTRTALNIAAALTKLLLTAILVWGVQHGHIYETRLPFLPGIDLLLDADALSVLLVSLSSVLWLATTVYAIAYLEHAPQSRSRFFGFFSLCVSSTIGIALAGNLVTFLLFYEMLTLSTYPLVVHRGTEESMRAGKIYLAYTMGGGTLFMVAVVWLSVIAGPLEFTEGGMLGRFAGSHANELRVIFVMLVAGLGVKAALVPLHGWLPRAMVAPAPVSALLHAVAVVKAGAFGIVRVVYDIYGVWLASELELLQPLAVVASMTIIYGSLCAMRQDNLKKRLAYSTVSQVSYIALGASILGPLAAVGGVVHLVHQGLMKITLFFCAGNLAERLGIHEISRMAGVGRRLPVTMAAFTLGAFGMIGAPPMAGFISKWYIGLGAVTAGAEWVIGVLVASTALNAAYFLPILHTIWFQEPAAELSRNTGHGHGRLEIHWMLLVPTGLTALLALLCGLLGDAPFSPLEWSRLIVEREFGK
jgi:multicomponent Na+:H+ antiporter subunit D